MRGRAYLGRQGGGRPGAAISVGESYRAPACCCLACSCLSVSMQFDELKSVRTMPSWTTVHGRDPADKSEIFYGRFALCCLPEISKIQISVRIQISAAARFSAGWLRISAIHQRLRSHAEDKGCTLVAESIANYSRIMYHWRGPAALGPPTGDCCTRMVHYVAVPNPNQELLMPKFTVGVPM
jgi:hypothetical protein